MQKKSDKPRITLNATESEMTVSDIINRSPHPPRVTTPMGSQDSNEVIDKLQILKNMLESQDSKVKRITTTKNQIMRTSLSIASNEGQNHSHISNYVRGTKRQKTYPIKGISLKQEEFEQGGFSSETTQRYPSGAVISPAHPFSKKDAFEASSVRNLNDITLKTKSSARSVHLSQGRPGELTSPSQLDFHPENLSYISINQAGERKEKEHKSGSRQEKVRELKNTLYSLISELGEEPLEMTNTSEPKSHKMKRVSSMVDVKIQTESLLDKGEMSGFKKQKGKKKMTRSNSHTMLNMVAGGAVAGAVFGGIYAAVKIFSKNNNN